MDTYQSIIFHLSRLQLLDSIVVEVTLLDEDTISLRYTDRITLTYSADSLLEILKVLRWGQVYGNESSSPYNLSILLDEALTF